MRLKREFRIPFPQVKISFGRMEFRGKGMTFFTFLCDKIKISII